MWVSELSQQLSSGPPSLLSSCKDESERHLDYALVFVTKDSWNVLANWLASGDLFI